jgi:Rhamnan synthesis protein F
MAPFRKFRRHLRDSWYCFSFDLLEWLNDARALSQGKHLTPTAEYDGALVGPDHPKRVAIVAIYPTESITFSILNLLNALQSAKFWILVVSTKRLDENQRQLIAKHCNHLLERFPVGRDFGSYQMGMRWLKENKKLENAEFLALANDSLFYPASFSERLQDFMSESTQWYALFECFEIHYHTQSFFQIFRRDMFLSPAFQGFWNDYTPYSARKHAIHKGEVEFSRRMVAAGFLSRVMFNTIRVCADVLTALKSEDTDTGIVLALKQTMKDDYFDTIERIKNNLVFETERELLSTVVADDIASRLSYHIENRNPTHSIGLLCSVLYNAPIKRDIVYRGHIELGTLISQCRGFTIKERALMGDDLRRKGLPASLTFSQRLVILYKNERI